MLLSSSTFGTATGELQGAVTALARKMATEDCQKVEEYYVLSTHTFG